MKALIIHLELLRHGQRISHLRLSVIVVSLLVLLVSRSYAKTIEIYPGTDVFTPAAEGLAAGDTLIVHQGTYNETNRMSIQVQGTSAAPIIIKSVDGEARPVITRPASASVQNTINIEGSARYLTIKGLEIIGNGGDGINMTGSLSFLTLENLVIHDVDVGVNFRSSMNHITVRSNQIYNTGRDGGTGEGMYVGCNNATCIVQDSVIENNWIHNNLPGTTQGDGIEIKVGSHSNIIRNNVIHDMLYPGILVYGTGTNPVNLVEGNAVWNCLEGITAISDAIVRNNIVFNSGCGFCSYSHPQVSQRKNVTTVHNTLYNNDDGLYIRWSGASFTVANNAVYSPGKSAVDSSGAGASAIQSNYVQGTMSGESVDGKRFVDGGSADSTFTNPTGWDFWPRQGSALIGSAAATYVSSVDFNGTIRLVPFDVGAYELEGLLSNPGWKVVSGFKQAVAKDSTPPAPPMNLQVK